MGTATIALLAALVAVVATAVVAVSLIRSRRGYEHRLTAGLVEVEARMDLLVQELAASVERARDEALRVRIVESLGQSLDADEVLARAVEAAASLPGVAAAAATVVVDGEELTASTGLTEGLPDPSPGESTATVGRAPGDTQVRAIGISYHYGAGEDVEQVVRSAVAVPLTSDGRHLGFLTVFGRSDEPPVAGSDVATLEAIAHQAGPALERARRRGEAGRPAGAVDPLTGLGNRQALHETLALDVARALRHGQRLALCTFDLDDFGRTSARLGPGDGDAALQSVAGLIRSSIGPEGSAFRSGGDEFTVILPGAGRIEGEALFARLQATLGRQGDLPSSGLSLSAGIAELKPGDDGVSLYERAERALTRAKQAGKGTAA